MGEPIDLYYFPPSPPCRTVMLVANAVGVNLNKKIINTMKGEQMNPDFVKLNPQHSIPTINDNGLVLWESRAIIKYLVDAYAKDDTLAPKDPKAAAMVNQRLFFDSDTLFSRIANYFKPVFFLGEQPNPEAAAKVDDALSFLNIFLQDHVWVAGQYMTIADFSIVVSVSTAEAVQFDISKYPNVHAWYQRCQKAMADYGYQEINQSGADMMGNLFKSKVEGN